MPATHTSHSSSSSLSSFSISPHWQILSGPTNLTFSEFLALLENNNDYERLMVTLFERHDFILKTNTIRHVAELIRRFQDEIDEQRDYIWSMFIEMEQAGIHELLNQDYKQTGGPFINNDEYDSCQQHLVVLLLQFHDHRLLILNQYHLLPCHAQSPYVFPWLHHNIPLQLHNMELHPNLLPLFQKFYSQISTSFQSEKHKKNLNDDWMNSIWNCRPMS